MLSQGIGAPLELYRLSKKLEEICALEINKAANKLIIFLSYPNYERTTAVPLLLYVVSP